jgi:hypothetical protein
MAEQAAVLARTPATRWRGSTSARCQRRPVQQRPGAAPSPHPSPPPRAAQAGKLRRTIIDNDKRKLERRIAHSAPGSIKVKPERKKKIVTEME